MKIIADLLKWPTEIYDVMILNHLVFAIAIIRTKIFSIL